MSIQEQEEHLEEALAALRDEVEALAREAGRNTKAIERLWECYTPTCKYCDALLELNDQFKYGYEQ